MVTTYTRDELGDRKRLVAAFALLTEHYAGFGTGGPEVDAAKMTVASIVTSYAMAQLVRRLVAEGYVRDERAAELFVRAGNLEAGRGFVIDETIGKSTGTKCAECGTDQFSTSAGVSCENGHGGAPAATVTTAKRKRSPTPPPPPPPADEQAILDNLFSL